jgi:hypothetical protein
MLRRLSDAQFCSDAHRGAYSEEQTLAFQRLMTTQSVGKTQRMPAYNQAAEIPKGRPATQTMVAEGGFRPYILDTPLPFEIHTAAAEPIATSLTVFFCDHAVAFPTRFRHSGRLARVSVKAGNGVFRSLIESGFVAPCRPGMPGSSTKPLRWEYQAPSVDSDPAMSTRLWPVESTASRGKAAGTPLELLWLNHGEHRVPNLAAATAGPRLRLVQTLLAVWAPDASRPGTPVWPLDYMAAWAHFLAYPSGEPLRAVAETVSVAEFPSAAEESFEPFDALAGQPLAGSRHLPALAAAVLKFGSPIGASMLPVTCGRSPLPAHSTDLAGLAALPWVKNTFATRMVEPARLAARPSVAPLAISTPDAALVRPGRKNVLPAPRLSAIAGPRRLQPLTGVALAFAPSPAEAHAPTWTPAIPSPAKPVSLRLPVADVRAYTGNLEAARSRALGWLPEPAAPVAAPAIPDLSSKHRLLVQAKGTVLAIARPAVCQIPSVRDAGDRLAPAFRPAPPVFRLAPLQGGHADGRTRCFAIAAPAAGAATWQSAGAEWSLKPEIALPLRKQQSTLECRLQRPSTTLFRIANAQPLPKASAGAPLALPMSDWASKPLMRPVNLRASDGTDFEENAHSGWQAKLRDRFAGLGSLPSFGRLKRLPPDIKWIAMAIPLIIGIWVVARPEGKASSAPVQVSGGVPQAEVEPIPAPAVSEDPQAVAAAEPDPPGLKKQKEVRPSTQPKAAEPTRWDILQAKVAERAAVDIVEDFRSGLSRWDGKGNWARTWSYDRSGTVRPGNMAIFEPTTGLRNYSFEMKAAVDKRVIQWLVRATDLSNYHINRLIVTPDAAQTKLELQRWTVHKGRAGRVKLVPLPYGPANQSLFAIRVEVQGESVTTYLGDQVIDTFSDTRLASGGIGLAGAPGDQARVYAVRVSHQTDFLGKLCSFLAPQPMNMQGTE